MPDLSKPHVARIVDYWLGGSHHYSVDRKIAKAAEEELPSLPDFQRVHRAFLKRAYAYLVLAVGLDKFVDFGSGLPTQGNVHEIVLEFDPSAKVIYSDHDLEVVEYGQEIVGVTHPEQVRYVFCEAAHPEEVLESEMIKSFFGGERRVGIGFTNLPHLMSDEDVRSAFETLYEWAAPGSHMVVSFGTDAIRQYPRILEIEERHGMERWWRSLDEMLSLLGSWQLTEHGVTYTRSWPKHSVPEDPLLLMSLGFLVRK
ncbi:MAG: hypothetical protein D6791_02640 [Chloroflexi bacterium]|nr:MAG: hypothetical protein D6791_02640 [Chloroflexota bacterium]